MQRVITEDGSVTYYNEEVGDHYHTKSGAKEEAIEKHAKALGIRPGKVIFDVFFGLGYNTAAALDIAPATVYCFENDPEILKKALELDPGFESFDMIKDFIRNFFRGEPVYEKGKIKLVMFFGDARTRIFDAPEKADYVFFDAFSPKKVPELWTERFFSDIKDRMKKGGKLSTYSYARFVRENMRKAGFKVIDGPIIGRRSPSTIGIAEN